MDGDGTVDGVIFADLLIGGSGCWNAEGDGFDPSYGGGSYNITTISSAKSYTISQESYEGKFGTQPVLKATNESGEDRFYVMSLSDFDSNHHKWYYSARYMYNYAETTSYDFGTGKANTETMIEKWNNSSYGRQNGDSTYTDIWGIVQEKYKEGWFVPSANEWAAFGSAFNIGSSNYNEKYGLNAYYWTSSAYAEDYAVSALCYAGKMGPRYTYAYNHFIRLSTIF